MSFDAGRHVTENSNGPTFLEVVERNTTTFGEGGLELEEARKS